MLPFILHNFHAETQNYLLDRVASEALRNWIEQFFVRKRISTTFGASPLFGENNILWTRHSHPRNLPQFINEIPRFNFLSIAYSLEFVFPEFTLSKLDLAQLTQSLEINTNRSEPLTLIVNSPVKENNYSDFRKMVAAMVLPQQIQIDIVYDLNHNDIVSRMEIH